MPKRKRRRGRHVIGGPNIPKGAVRLPTGGYESPARPSTHWDGRGRKHAITIRGVVRKPIDIERFARAVLDVTKRIQGPGP